MIRARGDALTSSPALDFHFPESASKTVEEDWA